MRVVLVVEIELVVELVVRWLVRVELVVEEMERVVELVVHLGLYGLELVLVASLACMGAELC